MSNKKVKLIIIGLAILIISLVGVTFAFFNYTRTGTMNNLGTGHISFNSEQNGVINITNVFPMTELEANGSNLDSITIDISGKTTYLDGEEFVVSFKDVNNIVNGKVVPITYTATYEAKNNQSIGDSSTDYWEERAAKNDIIYKLNANGRVDEDKQVLVGYIKNDTTGINGTLTIKAYIDANKMAISDTYPSGKAYEVNPNLTSEELNTCITYLNNGGFDMYISNGESMETYCNGTGTANSYTFQEILNMNFYSTGVLNYLENHNIIKYVGVNRTPNNWVNGRTIFTTNEWNSFMTNPISFKLRVESNEGIWVNKPGKIATCPECKFTYKLINPSNSSTHMWTTWNTGDHTPTELTTGLYDSYEDVIEESGRDYFLGVVLNEDNQVTKAYSCGLHGHTPFCIEGTSDGIEYNSDKEFLQGPDFWNDTCLVVTQYPGQANEYEYTYCTSNSSIIYARSNSNGGVNVGLVTMNNEVCQVTRSGIFGCISTTS